jgi:hypothetical protein
VRVERVDVALRGRGDRFLRLRDLEIAGHTRREAVAGPLQLDVRELHVRLREKKLLFRCAEIEQRRPDL